MCAGCRGLRDGYVGTVPAVPGPDRDAVSYCHGYRAGDVLRKAEWASGYRVRAMFDLDSPNPVTMYAPRIPQAVYVGCCSEEPQMEKSL